MFVSVDGACVRHPVHDYASITEEGIFIITDRITDTRL